MLNCMVMEGIIETSGRFDKYLGKFNHRMSYEELVEEEFIYIYGHVF